MSLAKVFWDQQWKQIWFPEEIAVSKDVKQWQDFEHQDTYKKVFGGLTLLDTVQTNIGMNEIAKYAPDMQEKAVLTVFAAFEAIHAKSYSYIFTTLCTNTEIDEVFEWVKKNEFLQYKAQRISDVYKCPACRGRPRVIRRWRPRTRRPCRRCRPGRCRPRGRSPARRRSPAPRSRRRRRTRRNSRG